MRTQRRLDGRASTSTHSSTSAHGDAPLLSLLDSSALTPARRDAGPAVLAPLLTREPHPRCFRWPSPTTRSCPDSEHGRHLVRVHSPPPGLNSPLPGTQPRGSLKGSATSRAEPSASQQGRAVVLLDEVHCLFGDFSEACNGHEACYGTCEADRRVAVRPTPSPRDLDNGALCFGPGAVYGATVRLFGKSAYRDAQEEARTCR
jgi:hypothetical protein